MMIDNPLGTVLLVFERNGRELERQVARDGDRTAAMAALLIARMAPLQVGDTMTVEEA